MTKYEIELLNAEDIIVTNGDTVTFKGELGKLLVNVLKDIRLDFDVHTFTSDDSFDEDECDDLEGWDIDFRYAVIDQYKR